MENTKKIKNTGFDVEIGLGDKQGWSVEKLNGIKAFAKKESGKRVQQRSVRNKMLAIQYRMEEYLEHRETATGKFFTLEKFLGEYLNALDLTLKRFAESIDTTDSNLKKYLSGDRKFNIDLAMKFAHFFHTPPDLWLKVYNKNQLIMLNRKAGLVKRYRKYDYEKILL